MKLITIAALAIASLFAGGNLTAQQNALEATVPFDFYVGQAAMPSGPYRIVPWSDHMLLVQHRTKGIAAFHLAYSGGMVQNDKAKLVFHKYTASPARYFLSEIHGLPVTGSLGLRPCALEKELQATVRTIETVTVP